MAGILRGRKEEVGFMVQEIRRRKESSQRLPRRGKVGGNPCGTMTDEEFIAKARAVPYQLHYEIGYLIDVAPDHLKERLWWIMRQKEILERLKNI